MNLRELQKVFLGKMAEDVRQTIEEQFIVQRIQPLCEAANDDCMCDGINFFYSHTGRIVYIAVR